VDGSASELAFHYEQAGESQRAIDYATRLTQTYADLTAPGEVTAWARLLPDAKEWGVEAPLADDDMKLAQKLARVLKTSIQNFRIFPANSEILVDTRDAAYEDLARLLEITESLTYSDAGDNMVINGREPLLGAFERNPVAELMAVLGRSGLKGISFRRGLTDDEIFHFLELLAQRPDEIRDQGGWTEILKRDNFEHIIVNERVYVSMSERELLEGKAGLVMPLGKDDAALQELVELIRNEGDTLRSQLLGSDAFKSRLDQLVKAVRGDSTPVVADASGLPPWLVGKKRGVGGHSPEEEQMDFLAEIWEDLVVLFKELESGSRQRANSATRILLSRGKEVVNPLFQFIKSSDDLRARKIAVKIVERFDPEVRNRLLREIRDTQQSDERLRMISLLEGYNTNDVLTTLQPSLHAQQRELRREAIRIVEAHGSTQAESLLVKAMQSEYEPVKLDAISALGRMGRNTAVPELIKVLKPSSVFADEKYVEAQCEACAALGRLKDRSAIPALARVLKRRWPFPLSLKRTKPSPVRAAAAAALGQFSDDSTRRVLERHTRDRDVAVRSVAKLVLGGETANLALE
jgi:HEAT repeat protein